MMNCRACSPTKGGDTTASRRPQPRKSAAPDPVQSWTRRWFGVSGGGRAVTVPFNLQRRLHQQETTYAVSLPIVAFRSREKGPGGTALRHPCRQRWHSISESAKDRKKEIARHSVDGSAGQCKNSSLDRETKGGNVIMASIKPLGDRVVVRPVEADDKTQSGLYIPDTAKEKPQRGTIVSVGPGRVEDGKKIDMSVGEGDTVLYGKYAGTEITIDGEDLLIMRESDILGIIED